MIYVKENAWINKVEDRTSKKKRAYTCYQNTGENLNHTGQRREFFLFFFCTTKNSAQTTMNYHKKNKPRIPKRKAMIFTGKQQKRRKGGNPSDAKIKTRNEEKKWRINQIHTRPTETQPPPPRKPRNPTKENARKRRKRNRPRRRSSKSGEAAIPIRSEGPRRRETAAKRLLSGDWRAGGIKRRESEGRRGRVVKVDP